LYLALDPRALRRTRLLAGLTQEGLAAKAGVHRNTLTRYETGVLKPGPDTIRRIAKALRCEITDLASIADD
jgi:transcriptional regulator with XRE-family HTH domain